MDISIAVAIIIGALITGIAGNYLADLFKKRSERRSWFYHDIEFFAGKVDEVREKSVQYWSTKSEGTVVDNRKYENINGIIHGLTEFIYHIPRISRRERREIKMSLSDFRYSCTLGDSKKIHKGKDLSYHLRKIEYNGNYLVAKLRRLRFK